MFSELRKKIAGEVVAPVPEEYWRDFGNIKRRTPRMLVIAAGVEDVQATVQFASRVGLRVVSRGHGCSSYGQSLSDQILIDMRRLSAVELESSGVVSVGTGCTWRSLQDYLVAKGLTSPVVVSGERATLGGTLSVGGFGPSSIQQGSVSEQVLSLDIVTGSGELIRAEPLGPHQKLFAYTLGGLGQTGIIVAARLRVEDYRPCSLIEQRTYPAHADLSQIARAVVAERPDLCRLVYLNGPQHWKLETGLSYAERPAPSDSGAAIVTDYFRELFAREAVFSQRMAQAQVRRGILKTATSARHIWSDFFVPSANANEFFRRIKPMFDDASIAIGLNGTILNNKRREDAPALPLLPLPEAGLVHSMGPYCVLPPEAVTDYLSRFDEAAQACLSLGGRQYLHGYHTCQASFYREQFGTEIFDEWLAVKRCYDAGSILGPQLF